ncbi:hypothetical protein BCR33DRAFT_715592 [Rhizoclosmatium globosum]|uniref:Uncharacterized protein n=1 Tax=Rhizoclosmatium globosum TaxID=329046 RepID=A0A1Y2CHM5_9FUNG|nr:hypothetical protein BCR33DRAFT_715592 [Rhizoclosmatium globosum]|eukprot:ORY46539.1 hypothetical protein BCR33DRAFT_715592 [Rhizoclosmatium globosum]
MADVASKGGDLFVQTYYKYYDSQRHENAAILWNGNAFNGIAAFKEFILHEYHAYDVQPLLVGDSNIVSVLVIREFRNVKIGDKQQTRPFSQTFVLTPVVDAEGKKILYVWNFR